MTIDELKKQVEEMQYKVEQTRTDLDYAENNLDDLESYASSGRDNISDCKVSVNDLDDELEDMKVHLDNLEGFDVDKVKREAFEEIGSALRDLVAQHIDKIVAQAVSAYEETDEPKKEPAKKSTETDNQ
jgi:chromosome segregation ATPase